MKIEFIHIPKCAGTSIRKAIDTVTTGHFSVRDSPNDPDFRFTFIRNPFDRIASLYRHMWRGNIAGVKELGWDFHKWFDLTVVGDQANRWNPKYWKPCYWWLTDEEGNMPVDFIGKIEQIDKDWEKLCKILDKNVILGVHNKSTNYNQNYTSDMISFMHKKYKDDFRVWYSNL